jgi:anion transporter
MKIINRNNTREEQRMGNTATIAKSPSFFKSYGLLIALAVLFIIFLCPTPEGLPAAGQRMIGVLAFAVIIWTTEAISYAASSVAILSVMSVLLGISPEVANPSKVLGMSRGLAMALGGFNNTAVAMIGGALVLAAAMQQSHYDKRIALYVLSKVGGKSSRMIIGLLIVGFILAVIVPSTTARAACMTPIAMGMAAALGVDKKSNIAGLLAITASYACSVGNIAVKTSAAQNLVGIGFIEKQIPGAVVSWTDWLVIAGPFSIAVAIASYYAMLKILPPETEEMPGGKAMIEKQLKELGPMSADEKKMLIITTALFLLWATERVLHPFDSSTLTVVACAIILMPKIGVLTWDAAEKHTSWGTLLLIGVGIGLGSVLLSTKAAAWMAKMVGDVFGITSMGAFPALLILAAFSTLIHLGFASATALTSAIMPVMIAVLQSIVTPNINVLGLAILLQITVSWGFILPVNSPQSMIAFGTDTFTVPDFIKIGIIAQIAIYALYAVFALTYWSWLGIL